MTRPARISSAEVALACPTCQGKGAIRWPFPSRKPIPAYWFEAGAHTCETCDGTGEAGT